MNISIVAGIVFGLVTCVLGMTSGGEIGNFWDVGSILIVLGGTLGALVAAYPLDKLKKLPVLLKFAIQKDEIDYMKQVDEIVEMANIARKNGLLALEDKMESISDSFIKNGVMLILDGTDPELVKSMMETEVYFMDERHNSLITMFDTGSKLAPAFGMVGTLIGLINMLKNLSGDMSTIGPAMSTALITTLYGVMIANLVFNPIASQLRARNEAEQLCKNIIIEGILSIQDGENPRVIEEKLKAFIAEADRKKMGAEAAQGAGEADE